MNRHSLCIILLFILVLFIPANGQTWKEMMDSCNAYQQVQDYQTALKWAKLSVPQAEKEFGSEDSNYAKCFYNIAKCYYSSGNLDSALFYGEISLNLSRNISKGDNPNLATRINLLGLIYLHKGNYTVAETLYNESLEMRRRLFKNDHQDIATSLNNLAELYEIRGNINVAGNLYNEALEMTRRIFQKDHPILASSINNMANFQHNRGSDLLAETLYQEALQMRKRLFNEDHPELANSLHSLAFFYEDRGNYIFAEPLYIESVEMLRRLFNGDHPDLATSINNLANFYYGVCNYVLAEKLFNESLKMRKRLIKGDHPDLANSVNNLAYFYRNIGNYAEAGPLYKEALEMKRRIFNGDHIDLALGINNLAYYYHFMGNNESAENLYKEALEMCRRIFKENHPYLAVCINNLGMHYYRMGNYIATEPLLKDALEMRRRIYKVDHTDLATSIMNMASFYKSIDNYTVAEPLFNEALEMRRRIHRGYHRDLANSIIKVADFYNNKSSFDIAEPLYLEGLNIYLKVISNYFPYLSEKEKGQFWNTMKQRFDRFNSFAVVRAYENRVILGNMFDNQVAIKGLLLNSTIKVKNRIIKSEERELIRKYEDWLFKKNKIIKLITQSQRDLRKKGINLDSVIKEANDKEKELSRLSEDFKNEYEKREIKWNDVKESLSENKAAIEIVRFKYYDKRWTDTVYYAALIVKDTSSFPELVLLENGNDLEGKFITDYQQRLEQQKKTIHDPEKIQNSLEDLYNQFWAPIQGKLKGIKTVYLSLDGVYNQINLNTLINPKTGKYLLDELDLRIVTSTRDLVEKNNTPLNPLSRGELSDTPLNPLSRGENTAELFGDPQFNLDSTKYIEVASRYMNDRLRDYYYMGNNLDSLSRQGISSLPGTRKEIEKIASDMKAKNWEVKTYLGAEALEEAIKAVKSPRILHIATHGKFLKDVEIKEERSFVMETQRYVENPLLRSMLLFAGAGNTINPNLTPTLSKGEGGSNYRARGEVLEDGFLTAYEAMNLNLDNTELVVLSACETGLGEIKNGEGVYGLQRAFQVAGAKSLIMSLWSVSDAATQELMTSFYDKWLSGKTKREAFREAQQELKKKYPGFYYWGAFVMVGE